MLYAAVNVTMEVSGIGIEVLHSVANLFQENELEKLSVEDGKGNKAKLTRQKENIIKVEYTSTTTL